MLRFQDIYKNQRSTILFSLKESSINQLLSIGINLKSVWKNANSYNFLEKNNFAFIDVTAIDNLEKRNRFSLVYNFINYHYGTRIFLTAQLNAYSSVPTFSNTFKGALTAEREVFDMYGIFFQDHTELRRLLTDYSFVGNPLKKDFPLSGFLETKYSYIKKTLIFKHVELAQEFRSFEFKNPWI